MLALTMIRKLAFAALCLAALAPLSAAQAQQAAELQVTYSDGQFQPNELRAPAGKSVAVRIKNLSGKAMEFESHALKVEKVIPAKGEGVVNVRAQKAGRYEFFDEFNEKARGALIVE
ncbi:MAG: cupredoxin domain-containing protein [Bradyrhizobium sp.]|uniref:cupredoxin domain-containing protein n=1 Tax=Bradyrhizobium sp. TaxID=376 RepID=UPI0025C4017B|nr:cupredoxin domain-containing protein [Bradyrhizobium sp.]MBI5262637.1 cupredoxin domain-containing protein [Bradyrhizobium sp.]